MVPRFISQIVPILSAIILLTAGEHSVSAQDLDSRVPAITAADSAFASGIRLFDRGEYADARIILERVVRIFPLNRYTTAAALMAAKCAYRLRDFHTAQRAFTSFLVDYPTSSYRDEARHTLRLAESALSRTMVDAIRIGVILSLDPEEVAQTQALFNGIRLAVDRRNESATGAPVQMLFRDTQGSPEHSAAAVRELAGHSVSFIVGALYSDQAIAAARAADRERVVFVAPLATDERVSAGRRFAFQANPSISMRGRMMARFAINGLLLNTFGVVVREDSDGIGQQLTDAFIEETSRLGGEINVISILPDENAWFRLPELLSADTLEYVDALYVPVTAADSEPVVGAFLSSLNRIRTDVRVLGNSAWHDIPMVVQASKYVVTYSNDYFVREKDPAVLDFQNRYIALAGEPPDRLGYSGYDVVSFLLDTRETVGKGSLREGILSAPLYNGLASRIEFRGSTVNRAMFFHRYRDNELALIR